MKRFVLCLLTVLIIAGCVLDCDAATRRKRTRRTKRRATPVKVLSSLPEVEGHQKPHEPFVVVRDSMPPITKGLDNKIIALWQSHGLYYNQRSGRWDWQRPKMFGTVEDLFPQAFVMQYLMPMLENAGAYVMSPRERDISTFEVIADTDGDNTADFFMLQSGREWQEGEKGSGFALPTAPLTYGDNPFVAGTSETIATVSNPESDEYATANWNAHIPERGKYAIYVSYGASENPAPDARYTIRHMGGTTDVEVNQRMGQGTWVYLGHYELDKGTSNLPIVQLSNYSSVPGTTVSADAVKIGGGMGNVARKSTKSPAYSASVSGAPRFNEGARYWLQWAGMPTQVYSESNNENDYTDDYKSRAEWVNYLAGGSEMLPDVAGLNIPIDLAFAFHTDAGVKTGDTVVGTLGIYSTDDGKRLGNGRTRYDCRDLTQSVISQIVGDIRKLHNKNWTDRGVRDKKYYEIRATKVPAMILELLSHQNFEDMKYGLDPQFQFDVSRAIYKGMLRYLSDRYGTPYVVQPLPVNSFSIENRGLGKYKLSWKPTHDPLEKTANPTSYIVEERIGDGSFWQIATVNKPYYEVDIDDNNIHSFRIIAANDGGRSFNSETLALCRPKQGEPELLIVNGFTRVSGPDWFETNGYSGFLHDKDRGVADGLDIFTIGNQYNFELFSEYASNEHPGFGATFGTFPDKTIAGNSFDYVYIHGQAVQASGAGFVSQSLDAFVESATPPGIIDIILGKQKTIPVAGAKDKYKFTIFTEKFMKRLQNHFDAGGALMLSGAYLGSESAQSDDAAAFVRENMGFSWLTAQGSTDGVVEEELNSLPGFGHYIFSFRISPSADFYAVETTDALTPVGEEATTIMRYAESRLPAGIATESVVSLGFPFETVIDSASRDRLMKQIINHLSKFTR